MSEFINYLRIENFLKQESVTRLISFCKKNEAEFAKAEMIPPSEGSRKSLVYYNYKDSIIQNRITSTLPMALPRLNLPIANIGGLTMDMQLTASGDGSFLAPHPDKTELTKHFLSFVYYFSATPKMFSGGKLLLHLRSPEDGCFVEVEPKNNSLILFDSKLWHEVLPVRVPSQQFIHSRFTVNGWFSNQVI